MVVCKARAALFGLLAGEGTALEVARFNSIRPQVPEVPPNGPAEGAEWGAGVLSGDPVALSGADKDRALRRGRPQQYCRGQRRQQCGALRHSLEATTAHTYVLGMMVRRWDVCSSCCC